MDRTAKLSRLIDKIIYQRYKRESLHQKKIVRADKKGAEKCTHSEKV